MALCDELIQEAERIFAEKWDVHNGQKVPEAAAVKLSNNAIHFDRATVLYADLAGSTKMVDSFSWHFAAEIYRAYLYCAARILRTEGGVITGYDGDRVMSLFIGDGQCSSAARAALKINYAVEKIIPPAIKKQYPNSTFQPKHVVGIDSSEIRVARTGVRGDNDLVWVGRAANYAAKLTGLPPTHATRITHSVFERLNDEAKYGGANKSLMWEEVTWTDMNNMKIYRSTWRWAI